AGVRLAGIEEPFTQGRLDALRAEGRTVFVDMTAAWCITCQVNERTVLAREAVQAAFRAGSVAYLKGDWTNQNPEITRLLESHGRSGVPLYLVYKGRGEARVLPQILTEAVVLDGIKAEKLAAR
ncbi:MAG: thioredoxin family protein, partial [Methylorubrum rhodinum]|uniref:thioredoxin family protein n=1 Tax=Methylorubrum rhodinum TaxID=29428 RepID=UPI003BB04483